MSAFFLPEDVRWILNKMQSAGFRADIVGGPVRDMIRGVKPYDFDITTSAIPEETKAVFRGERIIETGIKHGTVTLIKNGEQYEITTYRIDGEYEDSRHPKAVSFTTRIEDDLARRDFTVNAIAYSEEHGITDPFSGKADIEKKIIRTVGKAEDRFDEDALRIIRGIRFASTSGFSIEEKTKAAMLSKAHLLSNISKERIFTEWKKLIDGECAVPVLAEFKEVTDVFFPEVKVPENINIDAFYSASLLAKHISLFVSAGEEKYQSAMCRMKTDRATSDIGKTVIRSVGKYKNDDISLAYMLRDLGFESAKILLECEKILGLENESKIEKLINVAESGVPYKLSMLAINGSDLMKQGLIGEDIGKTLHVIQELVLSGQLKNEKAQLIEKVKELYNY